MSGPGIVDVVAGVLEEHQIDDDEICPCGCDVRDSETRFLRTHELRIAHQSRAVLAALTEAGTVEWGVRWGDGIQGYVNQKAAALTAAASGCAIVSRLTLPWTAVE